MCIRKHYVHLIPISFSKPDNLSFTKSVKYFMYIYIHLIFLSRGNNTPCKFQEALCLKRGKAPQAKT